MAPQESDQATNQWTPINDGEAKKQMQKNTARVKAAKEAVRIGKERYAKFEGQACKEEENFNAHAGEEKSENAAVTEEGQNEADAEAQVNTTQAITEGGLTEADAEAQVNTTQALTEFKPFPKLPLELRTKIWGLAAPDPCIVIQAQSFKSPYGYRYIRDGGKVPAVLHACKESRVEFLDTGDKVENGKGKKKVLDGGLARRQRAHPVYKLSFYTRSARTSRPVYFSAGHDSFWADAKGDADSHTPNAVTSIDVVPTLKHYICQPHLELNLRDLLAKSPQLDTLTIILSEYQLAWCNTGDRSQNMSLEPEVDGKLDERHLPAGTIANLDRFCYRTQHAQHLALMKTEFPEKKLPVLKYRFRSQFLANEGLELPIPPKDPLREFDQGFSLRELEQAQSRGDRDYRRY